MSTPHPHPIAAFLPLRTQTLVKRMDFGAMVSVDGFAGASSQGGGQFSSPLRPANFGMSRQRDLLGSSVQEHERPAGVEDYDWRSLKLARTEAMAAAASIKAAPLLLASNSYPVYGGGEKMLSFSSPPKHDSLMLASDGTFPYYNHPSTSSTPPSYLTNAGYSSGSSNVSMDGVLTRVRGPFTPSQWLELEHQALIYKYIVANVPVPASLLIPVRRSLAHSGFTPFSAGNFGSSSLGWGSFDLGYSGNADPEPGRCRRTDGKKWRCSRDAVADQKYCERHINRGRHRSRKHVEGQNSHAAKTMPVIAPSQPVLDDSVSGSAASPIVAPQQGTKCLQPNGTGPTHPQFNRILMGKESLNDHTQDSGNFSMITSMNSKPINALFPISKQHNSFETTQPQADFGLISSDSLLNPPNSSSDNISFSSNSKLDDQQPRSNLFRQFTDDWTKTHSDHSTVSWQDVEDMRSDRIPLSISKLVASSDFSASSSSPYHEKLLLSPLRLSRERDPINMGLGIGVPNEAGQRQANLIPISWEASMAGPLGEVLTNTNNTPKDQSRNSSLSLLNDGWDSSPQLESSPTGVLQKTSFNSLSSSNSSSPRAEKHKVNENSGNLCDDILGKTLVNPPAIPSL